MLREYRPHVTVLNLGLHYGTEPATPPHEYEYPVDLGLVLSSLASYVRDAPIGERPLALVRETTPQVTVGNGR